MLNVRILNRKECKMIAILIGVVMCFTTLAMPDAVYAASSEYDTLSERTALNQAMYEQANKEHTSSTVLARYKDKYLKDMFETEEKGMTSAQQAEVKEIADEILEAEKKELKVKSLTQYQMLRAFHDWIVEHFYYYADVNKISSSCDNPYYLLTTEYNNSAYGGKGKIRSRCNGYTATFIAFARSQGIPARAVAGEYISATRRIADNSRWKKLSELDTSHQWSQAYVESNGDGKKEWIVIDCNADCWNRYNTTERYVKEGNFAGDTYYQVRKAYFNVSAKRLAQSHIILSFRPGSKDLKYLSNSFEKEKITAFLGKTYSGKSNGKRINSSYSTSKPETWFSSNDKSSKGDGNGNLYKLYWPEDKGLYGSLDLSRFKALRNIEILDNNLTSLYLQNCPCLTTVCASGNDLKTIDTTGSKKLTLLSVQGNPSTYVAYTFNTNKTAVIKTYNSNGTVSVRYSKNSDGKHQHTASAYAKSGYKFVGWYRDGSCVSEEQKLVSTRKSSSTYIAKFAKILDQVSTPSVAESGSSVKVSWNKVSGADGYDVAQYSLKDGKYILVSDYFTKEPSKIFTATKGKTYYYKVRAYDVVDGEKFYAYWSKMKSYKR